MVSTRGEKKENKKGQQSKPSASVRLPPSSTPASVRIQPSSANASVKMKSSPAPTSVRQNPSPAPASARMQPSPTPSTDPPSKRSARRSTRKKLKKSSSQQSMDNSGRGNVEKTMCDDEDMTSIIGAPTVVTATTSESNLGIKEVAGVQKPPLLHFLPVVVKLEPSFSNPQQFFDNVKVNKNMVLTCVLVDYVPLFMVGDQIASINGVSLWNRRQFDQELTRLKSVESPENPILITVIRVWNYSCPTREMIEKVGGLPDDRNQYFVARLWHYGQMKGMAMNSVKKLVYVVEMREKTDASYGLMPGDNLLLVDGTLPLKQKAGKSFKKKLNEYRALLEKIGEDYKYVDIFAGRAISARSTPNPSLEAELINLYPDRVKSWQERSSTSPPPSPSDQRGPGAGSNTAQPLSSTKSEKDLDEPVNPLLEADALEIALRELCLLQQSVKIDCPLPNTDKGKSLLRVTPSTTSVRSSPSIIETSVYMPTSPTAALTSPTPGGTSSPGMLKKWMKQQPARQNVISFKPETETTKITSDVAEGSELKKCDPRSGIVAYIRNALNN